MSIVGVNCCSFVLVAKSLPARKIHQSHNSELFLCQSHLFRVNSIEAVLRAAAPRDRRFVRSGDATGGGRKFGLSRLFNGKSKFPRKWSDDKILNAVSEVATNPNSKWIQQTGKPGALFTKAGAHVKHKVEGVFDGVKIRAIVQGNEIITAFPIQ